MSKLFSILFIVLNLSLFAKRSDDTLGKQNSETVFLQTFINPAVQHFSFAAGYGFIKEKNEISFVLNVSPQMIINSDSEFNPIGNVYRPNGIGLNFCRFSNGRHKWFDGVLIWRNFFLFHFFEGEYMYAQLPNYAKAREFYFITSLGYGIKFNFGRFYLHPAWTLGVQAQKFILSSERRNKNEFHRELSGEIFLTAGFYF